MNSNIISLFNELSTEIIRKLNINEKDFEGNLSKLRKIALKCLFSSSSIEVRDPCQTVDGLSWRPSLIASDYCFHLEREGHVKASGILWDSIEAINSADTLAVDDILKFLLGLKKPYGETSFDRNPIALSGNDYFFSSHDPFEVLPTSLTECKTHISPEFSLDDSNVLLYKFVDRKDSDEGWINAFTVDSRVDQNKKSVTSDIEKLNQEGDAVTSAISKNSETDLSPWSHSLNASSNYYDAGYTWVPDANNFSDKYLNDLLAVPENVFKTKVIPKNQNKRTKTNLSHIIYEEERRASALITNIENKEMQIITEAKYVEDVRFLLNGISSTCFFFDEVLGTFNISPGICLKFLPPDTIEEFSRSFMEMGSCYLNLRKASDTALQYDIGLYGIIYQTFWSSVLDYLSIHSSKVATIHVDSSLISLKNSVKPLHSTIAILWKLCKKSNQVPTGGNLLSYIYDAACNVPQKQAQETLLSILTQCSSVYVSKNIRLWLFQGSLNCLWSTDFFVYIDTEKSSHRDRSYYLSIMIDLGKVPFFLRESVDRVLACGKAVHLLKLFNAESKLIQFMDSMKHPEIKICTTDEELDELHEKFQIYEATVHHMNSNDLEAQENMNDTPEEKMLSPIKSDIEIVSDNEAEAETKGKIVSDVQIVKSGIDTMTVVDNEKKRLQLQMEQLENMATNAKERANWRLKRIKHYSERSHGDANNGNELLDEEGNIIKNEQGIIGIFCNEESTANMNEINCNIADAKDSFLNIRNQTEINKLKNCESRLIFNNSDDNSNISESVLERDHTRTDQSLVKTDDMLGVREGKRLENKQLSQAAKNKLKNMRCSPDEEKGCGNFDGLAAMTDAMRNKIKVLGSEFNNPSPKEKHKVADAKSLTEAMRNKKKILNAEYEKNPIDNDVPVPKHEKELTEAMKNKMKVLGTEYNMIPLEENQKDVQGKEMTEAMRNKQKILGTEYGSGSTEDVLIPESRGQMTAATMNKLKIMGTEYGTSDWGVVKTQLKCSDNEILTDAMKNKMKILGSEYGNYEQTMEHNECTGQPEKVQNGPLTVAQKNKLKMFHSALDVTIDSKENDIVIAHKTFSPVSDKSTETYEDSEEWVICSKKTRNSWTPFQLAKSEDRPLLLDEIVKREFPCEGVNEMTPELLRKYLTRSLEVALSCQERIVNVALFRHYLTEENYLSHVHSLRKYFLLYDGQFSRSLTQGLFEALSKCTEPRQFFVRSKLSGIMNEALNYTSMDSPTQDLTLNFQLLGSLHLPCGISNAQLVSFQIVEMPSHLNVVSYDVLYPFQLSYKVSWPLNIILTEGALENYRKIFKLLLSLKRAHWSLNESFLLLKSHTKDQSIYGKKLANSPHYTKLAVYRHAMTLYIMALEEHICAFGPYEAWTAFIKDLESAKNLDDLYSSHVRYLKDILRSSFLVKSSNDLLGCIYKLIEMGLKYHRHLKASNWKLIDNGHYEHPHFDVLKYIFDNFCQTTSVFLKTLKKRVEHREWKVHLHLVQLIEMKLKI